MTIRWSSAYDARLIAGTAKGLSIQELADGIGCSQTMIKNRKSALGLTLNTQAASPYIPRANGTPAKAIVMLGEKGAMTLANLAKSMGVEERGLAFSLVLAVKHGLLCRDNIEPMARRTYWVPERPPVESAVSAAGEYAIPCRRDLPIRSISASTLASIAKVGADGKARRLC